MLTVGGWDVVGQAADGAGAIAEAARLCPHLVLLDLNLPDSSGLDVAERLADSAAPPTVVLTSTHEDEELVTLALERRAAGFVPKRLLSAEALSAVIAAG
jgi:DNA-binding NarL/FixJ family response regulator